ncbi:hypothetical protein BGZ63DRAFT_397690 [Mariannaea sp. PMI_226]|nr:hypothetical protein BGZ63DRAFT_397690 [Mariannaea sp. PMI_226]
MSSQAENTRNDHVDSETNSGPPPAIKTEELESSTTGIQPHQGNQDGDIDMGLTNENGTQDNQNGQEIPINQPQEALPANSESNNNTTGQQNIFQQVDPTSGESISGGGIAVTDQPQKGTKRKNTQSHEAMFSGGGFGNFLSFQRPSDGDGGPKRARFSSPVPSTAPSVTGTSPSPPKMGIQPSIEDEESQYMDEVCGPSTSDIQTIGWVRVIGSKKLFVNLYGTLDVGSFRIQSCKNPSFKQENNLDFGYSGTFYKGRYEKVEIYNRENIRKVIGVAWPQAPDLSPQQNLSLLDPKSQNFAAVLNLYVIVQWKHLEDSSNPESNEITAVSRAWWRANIKESHEKKSHTIYREKYYMRNKNGELVLNRNGWSDNVLYKIACHKERKYFEATNPGETFTVERSPSPFDADLPGIRSASMGPQPTPPQFQAARRDSPSLSHRASIADQTSVHRQGFPGAQIFPNEAMRDTAQSGTSRGQFIQAQNHRTQPNTLQQTPDASTGYPPDLQSLNDRMQMLHDEHERLALMRQNMFYNHPHTNKMYNPHAIGVF